jgi:hypothetical protein
MRLLTLVAVLAVVGGVASTGQAASTASAAPFTVAAVNPTPTLDDVLRLLGIVGRSGVKSAGTRNIHTLLDTIAEGESFEAVRAAILRLWRSDDLYEKALMAGLCDGMHWLYTHPDAQTTEQSWRAFLFSAIKSYVDRRTLLTYSFAASRRKVDAVTRTWNIAQVSPSSAQFYWRACGGR